MKYILITALILLPVGFAGGYFFHKTQTPALPLGGQHPLPFPNPLVSEHYELPLPQRTVSGLTLSDIASDSVTLALDTENFMGMRGFLPNGKESQVVSLSPDTTIVLRTPKTPEEMEADRIAEMEAFASESPETQDTNPQLPPMNMGAPFDPFSFMYKDTPLSTGDLRKGDTVEVTFGLCASDPVQSIVVYPQDAVAPADLGE
jgi:hypothetical protein